MNKQKTEAVPWTPETDEDRQKVQRELSLILSSTHFRNSKRYPALLRYVVEKTLDGETGQLKERTLGIEVFDRRPDYDTNADPVVRFSAGEIRKRIAQYYQENGERTDIRIDLPLGCYAPEFRVNLLSDDLDATPSEETDSVSHSISSASSSVPVANKSGLSRLTALHLWILFVALFAVCAVIYLQSSGSSSKQRLWQPLLNSSGPISLIVGTGNLELKLPEAPDTTLYDHMVGPYHHISLSSAIAIARSTNALDIRKRAYSVKEPQSTSLTDMRERPIILVGGLNNLWTLRLMQPLRYRLVQGPLAQIEDVKDPANKKWSIDFNQPFTAVKRDYGVVARYHDSSTNGPVLIVAGLGPYGTEAASEFILSEQYLKQIDERLPADWAHKNIEAVIETDVIAGEAGPPRLVAVTSW